MPHVPLRLLSAAAAAAARGWSVFPVWPGSKRPAIRGWEQHATTDLDALEGWWRQRPYNIGIACGPSGLLVVDIDRPDAAPDGLPPTYTVATPRGEHRYYAVDRRRPGRSSTGLLGSHVDTRAAGGYVIAAGSTLRDGSGIRCYRAGPPAEVAVAPSWLLGALEAPPRRAWEPPVQDGTRPASLLAAGASEVSTAAPGYRNTTLFTVALRLGRLAAAGVLDEGTVTAALLDACSVHVGCDGFTVEEAGRAIRNGLGYAAPCSRLAAITGPPESWSSVVRPKVSRPARGERR
jgi:hypothetical protein